MALANLSTSIPASRYSSDTQYIIVNHGAQLMVATGKPRFLWREAEISSCRLMAQSEYTIAPSIQLLCINVDLEPPVGFEWTGLRSLLPVLPASNFQLAARALQLSRWLIDHRFCGRCGQPTVLHHDEPRCECRHCDLSVYPRISPCVIGLVTDGDYCILARGTRHPEGLFSTLAGFIEVGESAEQAFAREVKEEVGVDIGQIRYFGSEVWPFPSQLMIGFEACYVGGEIMPNDDEICEAAWFHYTNLPLIPPNYTISGRIIQNFAQSRM